MAGIFDKRDLHAKADAEIRRLALARIASRCNFSFDTTLAETTGHEYRVEFGQTGRTLIFNVLRIHIFDIHARLCVDTRMAQCFGE